MPLEPQIVSYPFSEGIDSKSDDLVTQPPQQLTVYNGQFQQNGSIACRFGAQSLPNDNTSAFSYVASRDKELTGVTGSYLYTYDNSWQPVTHPALIVDSSTGANKLTLKSTPLSPAQPSLNPLITMPMSRLYLENDNVASDVATIGDFRVYAFYCPNQNYLTNGSFRGIYIQVVDIDNRVIGSTTYAVPAASFVTGVKCFSCNNMTDIYGTGVTGDMLGVMWTEWQEPSPGPSSNTLLKGIGIRADLISQTDAAFSSPFTIQTFIGSSVSNPDNFFCHCLDVATENVGNVLYSVTYDYDGSSSFSARKHHVNCLTGPMVPLSAGLTIPAYYPDVARSDTVICVSRAAYAPTSGQVNYIAYLTQPGNQLQTPIFNVQTLSADCTTVTSSGTQSVFPQELLSGSTVTSLCVYSDGSYSLAYNGQVVTASIANPIPIAISQAFFPIVSKMSRFITSNQTETTAWIAQTTVLPTDDFIEPNANYPSSLILMQNKVSYGNDSYLNTAVPICHFASGSMANIWYYLPSSSTTWFFYRGQGNPSLAPIYGKYGSSTHQTSYPTKSFAYPTMKYPDTVDGLTFNIGDAPEIYVNGNVSVFDTVIDMSARLTSCDFNGVTYYSSGSMFCFDSVSGGNAYFAALPTYCGAVRQVSTGGEQTAPGSFTYIFLFSYTNSLGQKIKTTPSKEFTSDNGTSGDNATYVSGVCYPFIDVANISPIVELYRLSPTDEQYHFVASFPVLSMIVPGSNGSPQWSFVDLLGPTAYDTNATLYTSDGELADDTPPALSHIATAKNRIFGCSSENGFVYYTKPLDEGQPAQWNLSQYIILPQGAGSPIATAEIDDKVLIFTPNAVYFIIGDGPDKYGSGAFSQLYQIPSAAGCDNYSSVVVFKMGVCYSFKNKIYMIGRDLTSTYIGAPVEEYLTVSASMGPCDYIPATEITSAVAIEDAQEIRFGCATQLPLSPSETFYGLMLVYNYHFNRWSVFTNLNSVSSCSLNGEHIIVRNTYPLTEAISSGMVLRMRNQIQTTPTVAPWFDSFPLPYGQAIRFCIEGPWIKFGAIRGFGRLWRIISTGKYIVPQNATIPALASLKIVTSIRYDMRPTVVTQGNAPWEQMSDLIIQLATEPVGLNTFEMVSFNLEQLVESAQIKIETIDYNTSGWCSCSFVGHDLEIGVAQTATRKTEASRTSSGDA